jgi:Fur family transcriptional regulator, ferric uptake regulator
MHISEEQCNEILEQHTVRRTDTRVQILILFFKYEHALSHSDFEHKLGIHFDPVTLYRTIQTFEQGGIIHEVPAAPGDEEAKFALKHELLLGNKKHEQEVHFICEVCQQTYILQDILSYEMNYKGGYEVKSIEITAKGICKSCKKKN